jgi:hypothetical protein
MAVSYEIDPRTKLVRTTCTGLVTLNEVMGHFQVLESDRRLPDPVNVLLDLREIQIAPETDQVRSIADQMGKMTNTIRWGALAIVAPRDLIFGMSRMLEMRTEHLFVATRVFRELGEAEKWLAESIVP